MDDGISTYLLDQAIEDGVLVEVFKDDWQKLTGGKPIVATAHLYNYVCSAEITGLVILREIWDNFVAWHTHDRDELADIFVTTLNGNKVWIIEDGNAFTMMYPEDY